MANQEDVKAYFELCRYASGEMEAGCGQEKSRRLAKGIEGLQRRQSYAQCLIGRCLFGYPAECLAETVYVRIDAQLFIANAQ